MYCDYHTHTPLCLHASGTPQEYVPVSYTHLDVYKRQAAAKSITCASKGKSSAPAPAARSVPVLSLIHI